MKKELPVEEVYEKTRAKAAQRQRLFDEFNRIIEDTAAALSIVEEGEVYKAKNAFQQMELLLLVMTQILHIQVEMNTYLELLTRKFCEQEEPL